MTLTMSSARRLAHDLNNIAFVISGYAQRIEEELPKTHPLQEDVQAILNEIPRLTAVGEQIRSLARILEPASSVAAE